MARPDNTDKVNPSVKVQAPLSKSEAASTHGGEGNQRPESHYKSIVDRAVNTTAKPTSKR
jgi:hypothetical protein